MPRLVRISDSDWANMERIEWVSATIGEDTIEELTLHMIGGDNELSVEGKWAPIVASQLGMEWSQ